MKTISFTTLKNDFEKQLDCLSKEHETLVITRKGKQSLVMMSLEEYQSLKETAYLLRSPVNASRLLAAINQLNAD
jgi:antitoxin YefM